MKATFYDVRPEFAHPEILEYLAAHNSDHFIDSRHDKAGQLGSERIKQAFDLPDADIHYLPNGTITNVTALSCILKPFEGVICPTTGHVNNYETGALEATGHKIIPIESSDGKLTPALIDTVLQQHGDYFMITPRVIYLTQVTEEGTVYTKDELTEIIAYAKHHGLYTYLDGARLAMALASKSASLTPQEFGQLGLDLFYVGGTKNGGIYGEALVIQNDRFKLDFLHYLKRQGAHMPKPRFMSLQFARFFDEDNLWLKLANHANAMADYLRQGLAEVGLKSAPVSDANHAFVVMQDDMLKALATEFEFERWRKIDADTTRIRLVCSWATRPEDVDSFIEATKQLTS